MLWPNGRSLSVPRPDRLSEVEAEMDLFAARHPGVLVERKPFSAAVHFRMAPAMKESCHQLAVDLETRTGLQLQAGSMVYELKAPWADKGTALAFLMAGSEMTGAKPVFVGDDLTDENGFVAAASLGGAGILVGAPRKSAAIYRIENVAATLAWLEAAAEALP
jgi:trehalose 6-phosphate phosphatase